MGNWQHHGTAAALLIATLWVTPALGARLYLMTEESPPTSMRGVNGTVVGSIADKVRALMQRTGTSYTMAIFPWARAYHTARHRANTCVFGTARTPDREPHFKWVGPLADHDWVLFRRADQALALRSLEDARPYLIGVYNGDVQEDYLRTRGFRLSTTLDAKDNLRDLLSGKIDLWATDRHTAQIQIRRLSTHGKIVPVLEFNRVGLYLACNPGVPDLLINALKAADEAMKKDGTARAIDQKYQGKQYQDAS